MSGLWRSRYCSVVYSVSSSTRSIALTTILVEHLRTINWSGKVDFQRTSLACRRLSIRCENSSGRRSATFDVSSSSADSPGDRGHTTSTGSKARRPSRMSVFCRCTSLDSSVQGYTSALYRSCSPIEPTDCFLGFFWRVFLKPGQTDRVVRRHIC